MDRDFWNIGRNRKPRQEWNPHWILKILSALWSIVFGAIKIAVGAAATVLMIVLICGFVFVGILGQYLESDILPESENYVITGISDLEQTTFLYYVDNNGEIQELQELHTSIDRQPVPYDEIPEDLIKAAIAIEDKRFYEHQGVDWITTVKACLNMFMGNGDFGGSTITQQLIKNDTGDKSVTVQRKVMEIFRAQYAEKLYTKENIMENYLNVIYFGRNCYGVKSAAREYFGKELQMLTTAECAALISITNNPSLYNPYRTTLDKGDLNGAERNRVRQLNTLEQMLEQELITQEEYDEAVAQEMVFKSGIAFEDQWEVCENPACDYAGIVSTLQVNGNKYYCPECGSLVPVDENASQEVYSYFVDTVIEDVAADLAALNGIDWDSMDKETRQLHRERLTQGGYHIYTTLDMDVQNQLDAIYTDVSKIPTTSSTQQLQSATVIIDNTTGDIVALVGGVGEKTVHDGWNIATDARLQTGSAQKPISVYAPAFESGVITPATVLKDMPISYANGKFPKNDSNRYDYAKTVFQGITSSHNTISCRTLGLIGFDYAYNFAKNSMGLEGLTDHYEASNGKIMNDLDYSPLALGALTLGVSVRDMSEAYATFANNGVWREARTYTKVYDAEGRLILDNTQATRQVMGEKAVNYMNYCLYNAANHGTGGAAVFQGQAIAGKTGTTSSNRDRWFCGYTGHYTAAVWCGYNNPEEIRLTGNTQNPAARLWRMFMQPIHQGKEWKALYNGNKFRTVSVCLDSGKLATAACALDARGVARTVTTYVYSGDAPSGYCDKHVTMDYCVTGGGVATEYCSKFAGVQLTEKSLVKMSKAEVDEIKRAATVGLYEVHSTDGYVFFNDGVWKGFKDTHTDNTYSYLPCPVHNKDAYDKMEEEKRLEEEKKQQEEEAKKEQEEQEKLEQEQAAQATTPDGT